MLETAATGDTQLHYAQAHKARAAAFRAAVSWLGQVIAKAKEKGPHRAARSDCVACA